MNDNMENSANNPLVSAFASEVERMGSGEATTVSKRLHFGIYGSVDPRKELWAGIVYYMGLEGRQPQWLPAYDQVATWLSDNKGRGLICVGTCGLGKTVICQKVLPVLFSRHFGMEVLSVTACEMNARIDELLQYCQRNRIVIIDDLGTEPAEVVNFGNRRKPFCELVDKAERNGTLLILTTNLRTTMMRLKEDCSLGKAGDPDPRRRISSIEERYGIPTLDRLRASTTVVLFTGQSLR